MTDFLFARPSFLGGMARVLDIGGTQQEYNYSLSGEQADRIALEQDWRAVYGDWAAAVPQIEAQVAQRRRHLKHRRLSAWKARHR